MRGAGLGTAFGQERPTVKRVSSRSTAKVSGPQNAGPLDRRVRPEGQKGAPRIGQGRSPRKTAGPRKRRSAARRIAGGACCTSAGGQKGLKAFGTGRSAGTGGCAHETGDGTNVQGQGRCAAVSRSVPCTARLGSTGLDSTR